MEQENDQSHSGTDLSDEAKKAKTDWRHTFISDIRSRLAAIASTLLKIEKNQQFNPSFNAVHYESLMREIHTIKACADFLQFPVLTHLSHRMEDLLHWAGECRLPMDKEMLDMLHFYVELSNQAVGDVTINMEWLQLDAARLVTDIEKKCTDMDASGSGHVTRLLRDDILSHHADELDALDHTDISDPAIVQGLFMLDELRRNVLFFEKMGNDLPDRAHETVVILEELRTLLTDYSPPVLLQLSRDLQSVISMLSQEGCEMDTTDLGVLADIAIVLRNCYARLFQGDEHFLPPGLSALTEMLADIRWHVRVNIPQGIIIPDITEPQDDDIVLLDSIVDQVRRMVLFSAGELNKDVTFESDIEEVYLDRETLNKLHVLFVHIIRNALDHGIETSRERMSAGKTPAGVIRFSAVTDDDGLSISISDDGRGIALDKLRQRAVESGRLTEVQAQQTDELALLLLPGVSTADIPTIYSGRGMGMRIIHDQVQAIGGTLKIKSIPGKGTTITIYIPFEE